MKLIPLLQDLGRGLDMAAAATLLERILAAPGELWSQDQCDQVSSPPPAALGAPRSRLKPRARTAKRQRLVASKEDWPTDSTTRVGTGGAGAEAAREAEERRQDVLRARRETQQRAREQRQRRKQRKQLRMQKMERSAPPLVQCTPALSVATREAPRDEGIPAADEYFRGLPRHKQLCARAQCRKPMAGSSPRDGCGEVAVELWCDHSGKGGRCELTFHPSCFKTLRRKLGDSWMACAIMCNRDGRSGCNRVVGVGCGMQRFCVPRQGMTPRLSR